MKGVGWTWQISVQGAVDLAKNDHRPQIRTSAMQEETVGGLGGGLSPRFTQGSHTTEIRACLSVCVFLPFTRPLAAVLMPVIVRESRVFNKRKCRI